MLLGQFTSDHPEKEFAKLRQGSGGAYFLTVQQIIEKVRINQASLLLKSDVDIGALGVESGHQCKSCTYKLSKEATEIFSGLKELEDFILLEVKKSLVRIAGYMTKNDKTLNKNERPGHTKFYFAKYGKFTQGLDGGCLKVPIDKALSEEIF